MFFGLAPTTAILSDANADLIRTYQAIKDDWRTVVRLLGKHHKHHSAEYYYKVRQNKPSTAAGQAAHFIYLNRACWNGLYRVNRKGEFNVPIGTKDWILSPDDDFMSISSALSEVSLRSGDFEEVINLATSGDFIFVDPPYTVAHNFNGFVKYNDQIFSWADQVRLRNSIERAAARGATVVMTNADHPSISELYAELRSPRILNRHSVISGKSTHRRKTTEALYVFGA